MASSAVPSARIAALPKAAAAAIAAVVAIVTGSVLAGVIAAVAHAAGVSRDFKQSQLGAIVPVIIVSTLISLACWLIISRRAAQPDALLNRLIPIVLLVSLIPDVLLGMSSQAHTTWAGIVALMIMHVAVAAALVLSFRTFIPPTKG